ncbi:MAG: hypothetical protein E5Y56_33415 [Mesorhizobium sp.]|nr:MAG: hypothetical protein E5Y56_33415 [Mesorhizobium sp.]
MTTAATMIAFVNAIVAATGISLFAFYLAGNVALALSLGGGTTIGLMTLFYYYQRLRTREMVRIAQEYGSGKTVL